MMELLQAWKELYRFSASYSQSVSGAKLHCQSKCM